MKRGRLLSLVLGFLAGCTSSPIDKTTHVFTREEMNKLPDAPVPRAPAVAAKAMNLEAYKEALAHHISSVNAGKIYSGRPQALLRAVIVLKFFVDESGKLTRSEVVRTNHDKVAEATALASLRGSAPFPRPGSALLRRGTVEISETWLFNNDGRFQLRTVAAPQMAD
jgi:protein TonB